MTILSLCGLNYILKERDTPLELAFADVKTCNYHDIQMTWLGQKMDVNHMEKVGEVAFQWTSLKHFKVFNALQINIVFKD